MEGRPLEEPLEGPRLEDGALVERARRGDVAAYETLVERYQEVAFRTAYVLTGEAAEAEDAAQEAFVKAYYHLGRFRPGAPFRPWLLRIVANEAHNRRTAAVRRAALALRAGAQRAAQAAQEEGHTSGDAAPSPEAVALAEEQRTLLLRAVNGLRAEDRLAIAYRFFFGLSEAEMAEALDCARGTVKSRLSRALGRLRVVLTAETEGAPHG